MGDWNISRKRYFGLPLPFYPCACGHAERVGSRAELEERAHRRARAARRSCTGPGSTRCRSAARRAARRCGGSRRSATPGSTPASSRSRRSAGRTRLGRARLRERGARAGPDRRRPARPRLLGAVVPGGLDLREPRADPALVLLELFMSVTLVGPLAVPAGAHLREAARRERARDAPLLGQRDRRRTRRSSGWARTSCAGMFSEPGPART